MLPILLNFVAIVSIVFAQEPCSPMDPGEWTPVRPVLYLNIYEANQEELLLYPNDPMYQSQVRINGVLDENSPNGIVLEPQTDYLIINPAEKFKFESVSGHSIIRLIQPLDRDGPTESVDDDISVITFTLKCSPANNLSVEIFYDVSIMIMDKNDNPPMFYNAPYETIINELTPVGTQLLTVTAVDKDLNLDGNITFSILKNSGIVNDGGELFDIDTLQGVLTVRGNLDYESLGDGHQYYVIRVVVMDGGPNTKRSAYTDIKIHVTDGNDNGPSYMYTGCLQHKMSCALPKYTIDVTAIILNQELQFNGFPDVTGNAIKILAKDMDGGPSDVAFSVATTYPSGYDSYFSVETKKVGTYFQAIVKQVKSVELPREFVILLKAEELSPEKKFAVAEISFVTHSTENNQQTTASPQMSTAAQTGEKTTDSQKNEFSQTTVALIVVIAVTLTLVLCLTVAMACFISKRRKDSSDKVPLSSVNGGHENRGYSAQL
ncbi:PCDH15 [Mytilus coruscus]|uniref:PCDH15 n=1 Tax=Mytilus coruscus TaxID=42192 RepID=A0A6J8D2P7_MYTCO|nr:PCDH15 [Mytilus coruscus]